MGMSYTGTGKKIITPDTIKTPIKDVDIFIKKHHRKPTYEEQMQIPSTIVLTSDSEPTTQSTKETVPHPDPSRKPVFINSPVQKLKYELQHGTAGDVLRASRELTQAGYTAQIKYKYQSQEQRQTSTIQTDTQVETRPPETYNPFNQTMPRRVSGQETISKTPYTPNSYTPNIDFNTLISEYNPKSQTTPRRDLQPLNLSSEQITPLDIDFKEISGNYDFTKEYTPKISSSKDLINISELKSQDINLDQEAISLIKSKRKGKYILAGGLILTSTAIGIGEGLYHTPEFFSPITYKGKWQVPVIQPTAEMIQSVATGELWSYAKSNPFRFKGQITGGIIGGKKITPLLPKLNVETTILPQTEPNIAVIKNLGLSYGVKGENFFSIGTAKRTYTENVDFDTVNKATITPQQKVIEGWKQSEPPSTGENLGPISKIFFRNDNPLKTPSPLEWEPSDIFLGEIETPFKIQVFNKAVDISSELKTLRQEGTASEGIRIAGAGETQIFQQTLLKIDPSLLDNPLREQSFIPITRKIIKGTYNQESKFIKDFPKTTEYLNEKQLNIIYGIAKDSKKILKNAYTPEETLTYTGTEGKAGIYQFNKKLKFTGKGQGYISGSLSRDPELSRDYMYGGEAYKLSKVPKDVDLHIEGSPEAIQYLADYAYGKLKNLGKFRQSGEGGIVKNAIEIKLPTGEWGKAVEFLGEGTIPDSMVPPDKIVGFAKEGKKTKINNIPKTSLSEELRGVTQGLGRVRQLDTGKIAIYPREGRLKDVGSFSVSARTLQQSMNAGLSKVKLQKDILKFESLYPEDVVKEQVKLAIDKPKVEILADYRRTPREKYSPISNIKQPKEIYLSMSPSKLSLSKSSYPSMSLSPSKSPYFSSKLSVSMSPSKLSSKSPSRSPSRSVYSFSPSISPSKSPSPSFSPSPSPSPSKSPSRSPSPYRYPSPSKTPLISPYRTSKNKRDMFSFKPLKEKKFKKGKLELYAIPDLLSVSQTEAYNYQKYGRGEAISPKLTKSVYNQAYIGYKYGQGRIPTLQQQKINKIWRK